MRAVLLVASFLAAAPGLAAGEKEAKSSSQCEAFFKRHAIEGMIVLLLKRNDEIMTKCSRDPSFYRDRKRNPFWGALDSQQLKELSRRQMNTCISRLRNPGRCKTQVNTLVERLDMITAGPFARDERDRAAQRARTYQLALEAAKSSPANAGPPKLYCCKFMNKIQWLNGANASSYQDFCDEKPEPCPAQTLTHSKIQEKTGGADRP